jgi:hypothetical protein
MDWELLMELPPYQLEHFFMDFTDKEINSKRWEIKRSLLSHTPMTKEAANSMSRELREMDREFKKITRNLRKPPIDRKAPIVSKVITTTYEPGESEEDYMPETIKAHNWIIET